MSGFGPTDVSRRGQPRFGWRPTKFCLFAQRLGFTAKDGVSAPGICRYCCHFSFFWKGQQFRRWMWMEGATGSWMDVDGERHPRSEYFADGEFYLHFTSDTSVELRGFEAKMCMQLTAQNASFHSHRKRWCSHSWAQHRSHQ